MADPFLSQVSIYGFSFAPRQWAMCDGQLIDIASNQALFSLLGTTYGGDGRNTFALPELRGRVPLHRSDTIMLGQRGGQEMVTLTTGQIPAHSHSLAVSRDEGTTNDPAGKVLATSAEDKAIYGPADNLASLNDQALAPAGGGQPHENVQPSLVLNFCISLAGIFPSRN